MSQLTRIKGQLINKTNHTLLKLCKNLRNSEKATDNIS